MCTLSAERTYLDFFPVLHEVLLDLFLRLIQLVDKPAHIIQLLLHLFLRPRLVVSLHGMVVVPVAVTVAVLCNINLIRGVHLRRTKQLNYI